MNTSVTVISSMMEVGRASVVSDRETSSTEDNTMEDAGHRNSGRRDEEEAAETSATYSISSAR